MATATKRLATYRWLASKLSPRWHECPSHWLEKARKIATATTAREVIAGYVNFGWMMDAMMNEPDVLEWAEGILALVRERTFVENL